MKHFLATLGVTLAIGGAVAPPIAQQPRENLTLGVMRRDGVILPFAAYDGDWSLPWPGSVRNLELPITLDAVPRKWWGGEMPAAWTLWPTGGQATVKVSPLAPVAILIGREKRLGVRTDFVSAEPPAPPFDVPYPKEGLAVAGDVKVAPVAGVSKRASVWKNLTTVLQEDIEEAEGKAIAMLKGTARWTHPISQAQRRSVFAELEAWYSSSLEQPGFGLSYIEAVKKYPPGPEDDGCGLETFVTGWIHTNSRQPKPKTDLTARVTYCDRNGASYMLPLGVVTVKKRTHWIFQMSSWDREWYTVIEATPGRVRFVAEYYAGGRTMPF